MSVLVDNETRLCVSGITAEHLPRDEQPALRHATGVGRDAGQGRRDVEGVPVFDTFHSAVDSTGANTTMIFVPPRFAADSILEAAEAGITTIIAITEASRPRRAAGLQPPVAGASRHAADRPQLPGRALAGQGERGHHPGRLLQGGQRRRGLTLGDAGLSDRKRDRPARLRQLVDRGHRRRSGPGSSFIDILELFEADGETELIVMAGEIGSAEEAAEFIASNVSKPVVAYIAGFTAPRARRWATRA
jgi:succinyl-CoA synthetase alpha subunit